MTYTATYSPDDNKLRLYASARLPADVYERVKAAGFKWAPKQELFVSPAWTPAREDLLIELAGEISDEDTSLVERAEERAERFEDYSEKRLSEAHNAREAVAAIADNIPMGQPILVGHHSERRARKDAEKIENGMRRAVKLWDTANYWTARAKGALLHAKYKELPAVRARRIKGIEADKRKTEKTKENYEMALRFWRGELSTKDHKTGEKRPIIITEDNREQIVRLLGGPLGNVAGVYLPAKEGDTPNMHPTAYTCLGNDFPTIYVPRTVAEVQSHALRVFARGVESSARWLAHYENRLAYEKAMLAEQGGTAADKFDLRPGGQVLCRGEWSTIIRVNKSGGQITSVTTNARYVGKISVERIQDYREPTEEAFLAVRRVTKVKPICNYPGKEFRHITSEHKETRYGFYREIPATDATGAHRVWHVLKGGGGLDCHAFIPAYITDKPTKLPPSKQPTDDGPKLPAPERNESRFESSRHVGRVETQDAEAFEALRDSAKAGVKVVSAPQLFPTPAALASRMVEEADIKPGQKILEPSAGTGALVGPIAQAAMGFDCGLRLTCVEINFTLAESLRELRRKWLWATEANFDVRCSDFLTLGEDLGTFDRVLMNPPFERGSDIKHIEHARRFLKPGGILVAVCANGPRQNDTLRPQVEASGGTWEDLPAGTFSEQGTNVNTALIVWPKADA
jgi:predicted RNA methylase